MSKKKVPKSSTSEVEHKYTLHFLSESIDEWRALDGSVKTLFYKILKKRLDEPFVPGGALSGALLGCYKIKLRKQGYRLVYEVKNDVLIVLVLAVDKREDNEVYASAEKRRGKEGSAAEL